MQICLPAGWIAFSRALSTVGGSNIHWYSRFGFGFGLGLDFRLGKRHAQGIRRIQRTTRKDIHIRQKACTWPALTHQHLYFGTCMPVNQ